MRLISIRMKNFRCYKDEIRIPIEPLTVIIGKNDAGKSTILDALNIFFGEGKIDKDDASTRGDKSDVIIACEFDDLPSKIVIDVNAETDLQSEYLLNRENHLEVIKVFNCDLATPKLAETRVLAHHPTDPQYDDLHALTNAKLKQRAKDLQINLVNVDDRKNHELRKAIWRNHGALTFQDTQIKLDDELRKAIEAHFPLYALFKSDRPSTDQDVEAQDPMKIAVREALKKKEKELEKIQKDVRKEVEALAKLTLKKLGEMDSSLAKRLNPRFEAPKWDNLFKISLTGDEEVPVNKRGSGVRRLILLNFFRAKAEQLRTSKNAVNMIFAIEEPETSQHPSNQRMLMEVFSDLADQPGNQVILSTHTPVLAQLAPVSALRYLEVNPKNKREIHFAKPSKTTLSAKVPKVVELASKALGVLPDHRVKLFVCVEGPHDISFLKNISKVLSKNKVSVNTALGNRSIPDFGKLEKEGKVIFVMLGGSTLKYWVTKLAGLHLPEFYLFDRDNTPPAAAKYQATADEINRKRGNRCKAVITNRKELENYLASHVVDSVISSELGRSIVVSRSANLHFDDVPVLVVNATGWKQGHAKKILNEKAARKMTYAELQAVDPAGELIGWFATMIEMGDLS